MKGKVGLVAEDYHCSIVDRQSQRTLPCGAHFLFLKCIFAPVISMYPMYIAVPVQTQRGIYFHVLQ